MDYYYVFIFILSILSGKLWYYNYFYLFYFSDFLKFLIIYGYSWISVGTHLSAGSPNMGNRADMGWGIRASTYPRGEGWGPIPCPHPTLLTPHWHSYSKPITSSLHFLPIREQQETHCMEESRTCQRWKE